MKRRAGINAKERARRNLFATLRERFDRLERVLSVSQSHQETAKKMISDMCDLAIFVTGNRAKTLREIKLKVHVLGAFLGNDDFDIEAQLATSIAKDISHFARQPSPRIKRKVVLEPAPPPPEHLRTLRFSAKRTNETLQELIEDKHKELTLVARSVRAHGVRARDIAN